MLNVILSFDILFMFMVNYIHICTIFQYIIIKYQNISKASQWDFV